MGLECGPIVSVNALCALFVFNISSLVTQNDDPRAKKNNPQGRTCTPSFRVTTEYVTRYTTRGILLDQSNVMTWNRTKDLRCFKLSHHHLLVIHTQSSYIHPTFRALVRTRSIKVWFLKSLGRSTIRYPCRSDSIGMSITVLETPRSRFHMI